MAKILLVEDDLTLAKTLSDYLTSEKHTVECVNNGSEALDRLRFYSYDAVIMDWDLPGMAGVSVCKSFRENGGITPVMMLTGKSSLDNKEEGFEVGADDYLTKPFEMRELSMRLRALLRRPASLVGASGKIEAGDIELNQLTHVVTKKGKPIKLFPREYALLEFLITHPNQVFSADALLERVWSADSEMSPESVRIYVARLRNKIDNKGETSRIETVHGFGYKFS